MNYCVLNGTSFDVTVSISDYEEWLEVLDGPNAGRSMNNGSMIRDPLAAFIGHKITFYRSGNNYAAFDALWTFLKVHACDESVTLVAADGQTTIEQEVYYTRASRKIDFVEDGVNYWNDLEVSFVPIDPAVAPT